MNCWILELGKIMTMKKILLGISIILSLTSCCKENILKKNENGYYGDVVKIIEYSSLKNSPLTENLKTDTTHIKTSYFVNGLKEKTEGYYTFNKESLITKNFYNENNKITKEKVYLADGSNFTLHYNYTGTLINTAEANYSSNDVKLKSLSKYFYYNNGILKRIIKNEIITDTHSKDTIQGYLENTEYDTKGDSEKYYIDFYDKNLLSESEIIKRDCNGLILSFKSYENDEFVSESTYDYKFDSIGNWIEARIKVNDTLRKVIERKIVYE